MGPEIMDYVVTTEGINIYDEILSASHLKISNFSSPRKFPAPICSRSWSEDCKCKMCGTCKYCIAFFHVSGVLALGICFAAISLHVIFGGTPPVYTMSIGFWLLFLNSFTAFYLAAFLSRVVGDGLYAPWTAKYIYTVIIFMVCFFLCSSVLFFIPVTESRMALFCRNYLKFYKHIPPFLDSMQRKFECCGVENYLDYYYPDKLGRGTRMKTFKSLVIPSDPKWYLVEHVNMYLYNASADVYFIDTGEIQDIMNKTIPERIRTIEVFNVTWSCCPRELRFINEYCHVDIERGSDEDKNNISARLRIHNPDLGCFSKYDSVVKKSTNSYQLPWLLTIMQWGAMVQAFEWFILIWVFRLTTKALIQHQVENPFEEPKPKKPSIDDYADMESLLEEEAAMGIASPSPPRTPTFSPRVSPRGSFPSLMQLPALHNPTSHHTFRHTPVKRVQ